MTDIARKALIPVQLQVGEHVQIHSPGYPPYDGIVEDFMPDHDVVWIRDLMTGERKMLSASEDRITRR